MAVRKLHTGNQLANIHFSEINKFYFAWFSRRKKYGPEKIEAPAYIFIFLSGLMVSRKQNSPQILINSAVVQSLSVSQSVSQSRSESPRAFWSAPRHGALE